MKRIVLFFTTTALVMLIGCSENEISKKNVELPKIYFEGKDTLITDSCQDFRLKNWTGKSCDGKIMFGKTWKPTGTYDVQRHIVTKQGSEVSADSLQKILGEKYSGTIQNPPVTGSNSSIFDVMPYWLEKILEFLWYLVLLLLAAWLVYSLIRWLYSNIPSMPHTAPGNSFLKNHQQANPGPITTVTPAKIGEITALVTAISAGGGGMVETEGMVVIINGAQSSLVTINHSGVGSYTGDVIIGDSSHGDITLFESNKE